MVALKLVPHRQEDSTVAAVGAPLVGKTRIIDASFWNSEVARVGEVEEIRAELHLVSLAESRGLSDAEINLTDAVAAKNIPADISETLDRRASVASPDALACRQCAEQ